MSLAAAGACAIASAFTLASAVVAATVVVGPVFTRAEKPTPETITLARTGATGSVELVAGTDAQNAIRRDGAAQPPSPFGELSARDSLEAVRASLAETLASKTRKGGARSAMSSLGGTKVERYGRTTAAKSGEGQIVRPIRLAIADLRKSLPASLWVDDDQLVLATPVGTHPHGLTVFKNSRSAVGQLAGLRTRRWARKDIQQTEYAIRRLGSTELAGHGCPAALGSITFYSRIERAKKNLAAGDALYDRRLPVLAAGQYGAAWLTAARANGIPCSAPAIAVAPLPILVTLPNLAPGDRVLAVASVEVTGSPAGRVVLYARALSTTSCTQNRLNCAAGTGIGDLADELHVSIRDTTTSLLVYSGTLAGLAASNLQITICAAGSQAVTGAKCTRSWRVDEVHSLAFIVTFARHGVSDNRYQGTGASVQLFWART